MHGISVFRCAIEVEFSLDGRATYSAPVNQKYTSRIIRNLNLSPEMTLHTSDNEHRPTNWFVDYKAPELIGRGRISRRDLAPQDTIYRYTSIARVLEIFDTKRLTLVSPRKWHDPYEDWWCDQIFNSKSKLANAQAFGSCWTTNYLDEPFWRLYTCACAGNVRALPAVRIATNVSRLIDAISWTEGIETAKVFIGRVRYPKRAAHLTHLATRLREGVEPQIAGRAANALFTKRFAYKFENEVRVLWIDRTKPRSFLHLTIDPFRLIKSIMVGPTKNERGVDYIVRELQKRGFLTSNIRKSGIYKVPASLPF